MFQKSQVVFEGSPVPRSPLVALAVIATVDLCIGHSSGTFPVLSWLQLRLSAQISSPYAPACKIDGVGFA